MDINEAKIIKNCHQGQFDDFGQLYDKYIKKIYDFIFYKTHHQETAEDLTSQTFFKALNKINNFDTNQGTFSSWLYRIARNTVIDYYRSKKTDLNIEDAWDLSDDQDLEKDIDLKDKIKDIEKYLSNLKTEQREIIIMRVWQEMSYKEISEALNKSEASCKMMFSRTINKLRQDMPLSLFVLMLLTKL